MLRHPQVTIYYSANNAQAKHELAGWRHVINASYEAIDVLSALLSLETFVGVLSELIRHPDYAVRCRALRLFSTKIEQYKGNLVCCPPLFFCLQSCAKRSILFFFGRVNVWFCIR
jgi:hypothetical protein